MIKRNGTRLAKIEERNQPFVPRNGHLIGVTTTEEDAIDDYGRDRIGPDDYIVFLVGPDPKDITNEDYRPPSEP